MRAYHSKSSLQAEYAVLIDEVDDLMGDVARVLDNVSVRLAESRVMADSIADIARLLGAWEILERRSSGPKAEQIRSLKERILDIEGRIKEARNDMERQQLRPQ